MLIAADTGGTKTVLALASVSRGKTRLKKISRYKNADFESFEKILDKYASDQDISLKGSLSIGVAGAVIDNRCRMTNADWIIDGPILERQYGFEKVVLTNDLVASGYGLDALSSDGMISLQKGDEVESGNRLIIAPGTGLGEAIIHKVGKTCYPIASEGGHADFAPFDGTTLRLWKHIRRSKARVSFEDLLSGDGLGRIFDFLVSENGIELDKKFVAELKADAGAAVTTRALESEYKPAMETVGLFLDILAAEAGNMALKSLPYGGVYIGGGIVPRLSELIDRERFVRIFSAKGVQGKLLEKIPVWLITDANLPLYGAAHILSTGY